MRNKPMTCSEIARGTGTTRQNVSQTLKKAMGKIYNSVLEEYKSPWKTVNAMMHILGVNNQTPHDIEEFFQMLPSKIREEAKEDAKKIWKLHPDM
jgi:transcriptional regulator